MQNSVRAFVAVDIPVDVKENIIAAAKELDADRFRAVGEDQMHITLVFLGDLGAKQVDSFKNIVSGINQKKFDVSLAGTGTFDIKRPRVIFAKIQKGAAELKSIYESMCGGLSEIIKPEERGFSPHVTIARLKRFDRSTIEAATNFIGRYKDYEFGSFTCDAVRLKKSVLKADGAEHTDIFVKELAAA